MSAHQATLDYVNQNLQTCSTEEVLGRRYKHNCFAEEQGSVNHEWLRLQAALDSQVKTYSTDSGVSRSSSISCYYYCCAAQVQELEPKLRRRTEQEARLQQTSDWITDRSRWMHSAVTPSSRAELRGNIAALQVRVSQGLPVLCLLLLLLLGFQGPVSEVRDFPDSNVSFMRLCQDLEEQIIHKCAALRELRDECDGGDQVDRCHFACHRDKTIQACVELARQVKESWQDPHRVVSQRSNYTPGGEVEEEEESLVSSWLPSSCRRTR